MAWYWGAQGSVPPHSFSIFLRTKANSLRITSLADPTPLSPVEPHHYKKGRGASLEIPGAGSRLFCKIAANLHLCSSSRAQRGISSAIPDQFSTTYELPPDFSLFRTPLFSGTSTLPNLQPFCFHAFALLPGGGGYRRYGYGTGAWLTTQTRVSVTAEGGTRGDFLTWLSSRGTLPAAATTAAGRYGAERYVLRPSHRGSPGSRGPSTRPGLRPPA